MLKHPEITKGRLVRFASELKAVLYPRSVALEKLETYAAPGRIAYAEAVKGKFRPAKVGERFGPGWSTHWFRIGYAVPKEWAGEEVLLHFDSSSEGCVWRDGVPIQGLTSYNWGPEEIRSHYTLAAKAKGGERGVFYVEGAINGMFGLSDGGGRTQDEALGHLRQARLVTRDRLAWDLMWDFAVIKEMAERLPADGLAQGPALTAANEIVNTVVLGDRSTYAAGRAIAKKFLAAKNGDRTHHVSAIGHAHIDTAWLWPLAETMRKCYRTFSTAVLMMDTYPEYKFVCSQAQQLAWIKVQQPALYAKLKEKAKTGQFVPAGGTWIEPDCNIPSGESLVRQFLAGQRFFKREFGSYCEEFWNPDVFGYSGALPQILRGAGIEYFLTQKLSWNQLNRPASSTFQWEGIDGSRVLTHFPPTDTYNAVCTVEEIQKHITNFKDKERAAESYLLFGFGDGGGGPTEEMVERLRRMKNVAGLPEVAMRTPREFFKRCDENLKDPTVWSGELYFELHRGTYTTQAANKRDNRRSEELLHDVEFLSFLARSLKGAKYPQAEINGLWETVLLNQFHDIIPGSSIREVYEDSDKDYARVLGSAGKLREEALAKVVPAGNGKGKNVLALNTLGWPRREVASLGGKWTFAEAPAYGYTVAAPAAAPAAPVKVTLGKNGFTLENGLVRAKFDGQGRLVSFLDKREADGGRETVEAGKKGNQYVLFEDRPERWDAWDTDIYHLDKRTDVDAVKALRVVGDDPLRATVEVEMTVSAKATLTQRISLSAESPRLDFEAEVDWREKDRFLKVEFPLALRSDYATFEIQFGHVRRPTHFNTTWDFARFEVSAHKWADLSEPAYGVALLNDSKYGYACHGNVLRLSLLRAPKSPDPEADMGVHRFRYALYPHANGPQLGGVIPEAAAFNQPLQVSATGAAPGAKGFFASTNPAVVIDTIKKAEDSDDLVVRLFESHGAHQNATFRSAFPIAKAAKVNLLEEGGKAVPVGKEGIKLALRPFEVVTLKLALKKG
ncbi:alpha-mannosidase [Verrucomicrobium sp. GAS474]|uniref:alpha-mannosidase n=1 Tax=Verrucomicrobium sp. GAS474 TaxID=1882831 RepID=UPI00087CBB96|nr:alpha-mannosidase [Verrucomicrobium sp. GAS474]SDU27273.1 alpha-mannosidase [Verrucomicrobium sp. GAS474]